MLLKDYFPNIGKKYEKTFFSDICFESSKVKKDNVFFAIKGTNIDGNNFVLDAMFGSTNEQYGTSYKSRYDNPKYQFAGKTGMELRRLEE